jgi:transposase
MANKKYDPELIKKIIRLHLEDGRTIKSLNEEYKLGSGTLRYWLDKYREECKSDEKLKEEAEGYDEVKELRKKLAELEKENRFLKKAAAFFAKEIDD